MCDYLPKFYIDFENKDGRDAGKDIALEVGEAQVKR
jgi:carboxyl-terminal processing protease